jgi:hypothetical protein
MCYNYVIEAENMLAIPELMTYIILPMLPLMINKVGHPGTKINSNNQLI